MTLWARPEKMLLVTLTQGKGTRVEEAQVDLLRRQSPTQFDRHPAAARSREI